MKQKREIFTAFALITQLGISMLTPILLCVLLARGIAHWFHTDWMPALILLGIAAGIRNCYMLLSKFVHEDKNPKK